MTPEQALDRARKLLALATSPDVHEAAAAATHAQALITRHRLEAWLDAGRGLAEGTGESTRHPRGTDALGFTDQILITRNSRCHSVVERSG